MGSENVLKRLLTPKLNLEKEKVLEKLFRPEFEENRAVKKSAGRPRVDKKLRAKNLTLCLAPQFVDFLDRMTVKDSKVKGRGRKVRFIIERFIEHEKRTLQHIKILTNALSKVQTHLSTYKLRVKKGEKLQLSSKEKMSISSLVSEVHVLLKLLCYSPKTLQKILPKEEWSILCFCLDWKASKGVAL